MAEETKAEVKEAQHEGAFMLSLKRNHKDIRGDRAAAIGEDAQIMYRRAVEDLEVNIKRLQRDRENMLDLSPTTTITLKLASDFDSHEFVTKDIELGVKIRNAEIQLDIARKQYTYLFGGA